MKCLHSSQVLCVNIVLILIISIVTAQRVCSKKRNDEMDEKMAKVLAMGEHGRPYPENKKQLKAFCDESVVLMKSLEDFNKKCFRGTLRQYANIFLFSSKQSIKRFCSKNSRQASTLLTAAKCVNQNRAKMGRCMDSMTRNFVGIKYAEDSKKIPMICCQYVQLTDCFRDAMGDSCPDQQGLINEVLHSVTGNFVDSTCGEYNGDSDKCLKMPKPPAVKPNEVMPKSLLFPVFDIINSLPE